LAGADNLGGRVPLIRDIDPSTSSRQEELKKKKSATDKWRANSGRKK